MSYTDKNTFIAAPRVNTNLPCDMQHAIADISQATVDLTTVAGAGKFAAQRVRFNNDTAAAIDAVVVPEQRNNPTTGAAGVVEMTFTVSANRDYTPPFPIRAIIHTGSGALSAVACWWHATVADSFINR